MATMAQTAQLSGSSVKATAGVKATAIARKLRLAALQGNQTKIKLLLTTLLEHPARRSDEWLQYQLGVLEDFSMTLHTLAFVDELTGLFNRRGFLRSATRQLGQLRVYGHRAIVFYVDVDNLKQVNDANGHEAGDALLRDTAGVLRRSFRTRDVIGRLGGDEFAVLAIAQSSAEAALMLERLAAAVDACNAERQGAQLSLSTGYVEYDPAKPASLADMLRAADGLMYSRKLAKILVLDPALRCRPVA
jgi:diguanylate cyclase (GGDEF)-like protein